MCVWRYVECVLCVCVLARVKVYRIFEGFNERGNQLRVPLVDGERGGDGGGDIVEWRRRSRSCIQVVGRPQWPPMRLDLLHTQSLTNRHQSHCWLCKHHCKYDWPDRDNSTSSRLDFDNFHRRNYCYCCCCCCCCCKPVEVAASSWNWHLIYK